MATTNISGSTVRNNGGTVVLGGNISSNDAITNAPDKEYLGAGSKDPSKVYGPSSDVGNAKILSAGNFGTMPAGHYIIKKDDITSNLAGVSYDGMNESSDKGVRQSIHSLTSRKTVLIDSWDYATGEPTYNAGNPSDDSFGTDDAAHPTASTPGELAFMYGAVAPKLADYSARTLW